MPAHGIGVSARGGQLEEGERGNPAEAGFFWTIRIVRHSLILWYSFWRGRSLHHIRWETVKKTRRGVLRRDRRG
jgi:hypothetical protein